ncbi:MAG: UDP-glucose 4-epimerase GalE [Lentisphaerae bacterium RIFOXYC12_FULL_60_16]|nr:MAG: UDP-glucose 4-epimerase GalE [Lentisphaerae bacterium RIFOXYC12_FULL_60_16]OGV74486.1 MAG: UDP-glucose 4-epimerase GalE [Lentisphaerae bacterium RIFOXYA12_FULL_60_10]OGV76042.1 MAG: UDP-glucose 4-epimerase GalE [Lentisphaerae bacterium RIFOXYB12_FULL_60_10]
MKVLVTGGAGYIGSVTVQRLLDAGHAVSILDNLERGHREALDPRAVFHRADLRNRQAVIDVLQREQPDAVMHFAAYALVGESMADPAMYFVNNVAGGMHLLEAMDVVGVRRLVFSSSCATYGDPGLDLITEDTVQRPQNPYGETKLQFEIAARWYARLKGLHPVFLRYFNACGATATRGEDHDPETHLIPIVLQAALGRRPAVRVMGTDYPTPDGTCIRDYIHLEDLADAHVRALQTPASDAFNLGIGTGYSVRQVIEAARVVTGRTIPVEEAPRRAGDPPRLVAAAQRAREELGWKPRFTDLESILESAWKWHCAHPDGYAGGRG